MTTEAPPIIPATGTEQPHKWADKYETVEAFEAGVKELRTKHGLPALDKPLYGKGGLYSDVGAAEVGYKEMETLLGKIGAGAKPQPKPGEKPSADPLKIEDAPAQDEDVAALLKRTGLDGAAIATEWQTSGKLTDEQYAAFKKAGYGKGVVDTFMQGQAATRQVLTSEQQSIRSGAVELVGGDQQLADLLAGAKEFVPAGELADFNARLGKKSSFRGAIRDLMELQAQHNETAGSKPLISGTGSPNAASAGFASRSDWVAARQRVRSGTATAQDKARILNTPDGGPE